MSTATRWMIGIIAMVCAVSFVAVALTVPPDAMSITGIWVMAAFCLLIGAACLPRPFGSIALRIIGATAFFLGIAYIVSQIGKPLPTPETYRRSDTNIVNGLLFTIVFGLPGGYYAITGKPPFWGRFRQSAEQPPAAVDETT